MISQVSGNKLEVCEVQDQFVTYSPRTDKIILELFFLVTLKPSESSDSFWYSVSICDIDHYGQTISLDPYICLTDRDFDQTDCTVLINSGVPISLRGGFEFDASESEQGLLQRATCILIQHAK